LCKKMFSFQVELHPAGRVLRPYGTASDHVAGSRVERAEGSRPAELPVSSHQRSGAGRPSEHRQGPLRFGVAGGGVRDDRTGRRKWPTSTIGPVDGRKEVLDLLGIARQATQRVVRSPARDIPRAAGGRPRRSSWRHRPMPPCNQHDGRAWRCPPACAIEAGSGSWGPARVAPRQTERENWSNRPAGSGAANEEAFSMECGVFWE